MGPISPLMIAGVVLPPQDHLPASVHTCDGFAKGTPGHSVYSAPGEKSREEQRKHLFTRSPGSAWTSAPEEPCWIRSRKGRQYVPQLPWGESNTARAGSTWILSLGCSTRTCCIGRATKSSILRHTGATEEGAPWIRPH